MAYNIFSVFDWGGFIVLSSALTVIIELITILLRFGCNLRSQSNLRFLGYLTGGVRIHHMNAGIIIFMIVPFLQIPLFWQQAVLAAGAALVLSDLIHHFLVLWPITGSHEFDLTYPD